MPRQFPLIRSLDNLIWNLRHYQPSTKRPPFRASRHPFCTNVQLRDVSYAYWFEETSRDLRRKLAAKKAIKSKDHEKTFWKKPSQESSNSIAPASSAGLASEDVSRPQLTSEPRISEEEIEIVRLFQLGDFEQMYSKLQLFKARKTVIPTELLNEMATRVYNDLPTNSADTYLLQSTIEPPMFFMHDDLRYSNMRIKTSYRLNYLFKIFELYEPIAHGDDKFLQHYIWLCYHQGDLQKLQKLLYVYLQCSNYDSRTLSYAVNAFVYNYDVQFSRSLLESIIRMNKSLAETLLSSTLVAYVKVGALYDNLDNILRLWLASDNCESPFPSSVALLIEQAQKYGTAEEINYLDQLCESLDYNNNFLIEMVRDQSRILCRDHNQKKVLTAEDVNKILEVRNAIGNSKHALKVFYESYIDFFGRFCNMSMVQLMLREMKKDDIPISKFAYDSIISHYVANSKFVQLHKFTSKFVSKYLRFEAYYTKQLFEAFIKTYPYNGVEFANAFHNWVENQSELSSEEKMLIAKECQVISSGSQMTPCALKKYTLDNKKKYDSPGWSHLKQTTGGPIAKMQKRHQIQFRTIEGIRGVLRKGIRPDFYVIENTLKNSNASMRLKILNSLPELRMQHSDARLRMQHFLLGYPRKEDFSKFAKEMLHALNTSDKVLLARRCINSYNFEAASLLLKSLTPSDMTDGRRMFILNLRLRNEILKNDYEGCIREIEGFAIDSITLSPYIYNQCRYIEKMIYRRIESRKEDGHTSLEDMHLALKKLRGLIGDIQVRLQKDEIDIERIVRDMFQMLDGWIKSSREQDVRKA